ncbi:unnamed protein product [Urochloa humidicola]
MDTFTSRRRWCKKSCSSSSAPSEDRDWAALPHDVLFDVFLRLGSCEIMWGAEGVCKAWWRVVVEEPKLWRHIHITAVPEWSSIDIAVRDAVDRGAGLCEVFSGPWDDDSLLYLAERMRRSRTDGGSTSTSYLMGRMRVLPLSWMTHLMIPTDAL